MRISVELCRVAGSLRVKTIGNDVDFLSISLQLWIVTASKLVDSVIVDAYACNASREGK